METVKTKCVNGYIQAGDLVISTPDNEYTCLIGRVLQVNPVGSPEHNEETENEYDDVHVNFISDYSEKRIKEIEADFSELYEEKKTFSECPIDDTIESPNCLIHITDIEPERLESLLESGYNAACYCYGVLSKLTLWNGSRPEPVK